MVFQNFQLFPHQTAIENVMEGLVTVLRWPADRALSPRGRAFDQGRHGAQDGRLAIDAVGWTTAARGDRSCPGPSPRVLLCDEPTSALDPELAAEVVDVLGQLANEGTTMVMATHDLRLASKIATSVVFLEAGNIVETGPSRAIFGAPTQERTKQFISTLNAGHTYDI